MKKKREEGEAEEEEDESAAGGVASEGAETPLGTAFTCSRRPTAEYCRRLVVMETGRQSRLLVELWKNEASLAPPSPLSSFHSSLPHGQTHSRDRKPDGGNLQVDFLQPETKTGTGRCRWSRGQFIRRGVEVPSDVPNTCVVTTCKVEGEE